MLWTTKKIKEKEFVIVTREQDYDRFVIQVVALNICSDAKIYSSRRTQITYLKVDNTSTEIPSKYKNFA